MEDILVFRGLKVFISDNLSIWYPTVDFKCAVTFLKKLHLKIIIFQNIDSLIRQKLGHSIFAWNDESVQSFTTTIILGNETEDMSKRKLSLSLKKVIFE